LAIDKFSTMAYWLSLKKKRVLMTGRAHPRWKLSACSWQIGPASQSGGKFFPIGEPVPPLRRGRALRPQSRGSRVVFAPPRRSGAVEAGRPSRRVARGVTSGGGGGDDGRPPLQQHPPRRPHRHGELLPPSSGLCGWPSVDF
jgi:hypothetical protein